jgi:NAD(P)-dependent dehydrogenase (short-subunit alcohol dehydrogenase family)
MLMKDDLKGKTAIITGSGKKTGIGYAIAEKLAENGCNVVIADLAGDMESISKELAKTYGVKALPVTVDVTDNDAIQAMVEAVKGEFDGVDILCNNAGASFGVPNTVQNYDEDAWMKTIDVNLHSVFKVSRAVVPLMTGRKASIINTSSRAGKVPPIFNGAYAVAKSGVNMLTKVMAREMAGAGIRVNAICPGQIMTDLERWRFGLEAEVFQCTAEEREEEMCKTIPLGRIGDPAEAARLVVFLASEESSYITGQAINVCGGQLMEL